VLTAFYRFRYDSGVKVSEEMIRATIDGLSVDGKPVTGLAVRAALQAQCGSRGGTRRVYAILATHRPLPRPPSCLSADPPTDPTERAALLQRAELAEHRERVHQEKWAREKYELREELERWRALAKDRELVSEYNAELKRLLAGASAQIDALRGELRRARELQTTQTAPAGTPSTTS
jgi:hypothetical protein